MIGIDNKDIVVGQRVKADFEDVDDTLTLLCFRPA
jgi:hypothetical protein